MARAIGPSAAVLAGRERRVGVAAAGQVHWKWFDKEVNSKVKLTMFQRVTLATEYLKSKVVTNIGRPVTKSIGVRSGRIVVSDRSKPGEFPKVDTERLQGDVFGTVSNLGNNVTEGRVGTTLDYGLILETKLNRSFLVKTLNQERGRIKQLLTRPMRT